MRLNNCGGGSGGGGGASACCEPSILDMEETMELSVSQYLRKSSTSPTCDRGGDRGINFGQSCASRSCPSGGCTQYNLSLVGDALQADSSIQILHAVTCAELEPFEDSTTTYARVLIALQVSLHLRVEHARCAMPDGFSQIVGNLRAEIARRHSSLAALVPRPVKVAQ